MRSRFVAVYCGRMDGELTKTRASFHEPDLAGRLPTLDGFRGAAVLLVILGHWTFLSESTAPVERAIGAAADFGWAGVELFFVLSGFLITGILLDARRDAAPHYFRDFYARRALRIFPLYYAYVFVFLVALRLGPIARHLPAAFADAKLLGSHAPNPWWFWLYASNFLFARRGLTDTLGPTWSLAIEEQFYLVWPAIVWVCGRRALMGVCGGVIALAIACRAVLSFKGITYPAGYVLTPCHTDGLAIGAAVAILARGPGGMLRWLRPAVVVGIVSGVALALTGWRVAARGGALRESAWAQPTLYTLLAVISGAALLLAACATPASGLGRVLGSRAMRTLGKYSYALYLFNLPVYTALHRLFKFDAWRPVWVGYASRLPAQLATYAIGGAVLFTAAWVSWHVYESQFLKLKRFFPSAAAPPADAEVYPSETQRKGGVLVA